MVVGSWEPENCEERNNGTEIVTYLQSPFIEWNMGIAFLEVIIGQDEAFLQHHCGFDDRHNTTSTLEMANV